MNFRGWPFLALIAVAAAAAIGCVLLILGGGGNARTVLIALSAAMGFGFLNAVFYLWNESVANSEERRRLVADVRNDLMQFDLRLRQDQERQASLTDEFIEMRQSIDMTTSMLASGFEELKGSYGQLAEQLRDGISSMAQITAATQNLTQADHTYYSQQSYFEPFVPTVEAETSFDDQDFLRQTIDDEEPVEFTPEIASAPMAAPAPEKKSVVDQLVTTLEPVVDLFTGKTAHYRLQLSLEKPDGSEVPTDVLLNHADRSGLRTGFDTHATEEALGLLRLLHARDGQLNIFMPIGAATLNSIDALNRIQAVRQKYKNVADSLVFEIPHAMLAGLTDRGLEGLATLARNGCVLSLSNVSIHGLDLASMARLNVRFASINAATVLANNGPAQNVMVFSQMARANRVMTIVTQVNDAQEAKRLMRVARFAAGPGFAAPRRVKVGVANEPAEAMQSAA